MPYANNKGADQPAHPRSLISTVIVRCLDGLVSVAEQTDLSYAWSQTPEDRFSRDEAHIHFLFLLNSGYI